VIQKALQVAVEPHFSLFIAKLKPEVDLLLKSNDFGNKIYHRLIKQYPQLINNSAEFVPNRSGQSKNNQNRNNNRKSNNQQNS